MSGGIESVGTVVIGGGMAGLPMAIRASRHGPAVLIEKDLLGGTCLNRGCIPTKTMIHSAKVAQTVRRASEFGVETDGLGVDLKAVVARKDSIVKSVRDGSYRAADRADGLTLIENEARFVDERTVEADGVVYRSDHVVINTGARPTLLDIDGLSGSGYLDSSSILDITDLPEHLIVIGGGYVGCEFAQMFRRFGSAVTVIQRGERLLTAEDPETSEVVQSAFESEGIDVRTGAEVKGIHRRPGGSLEVQVDEDTVTGSDVLLAIGRTPNTERLGLESAGVDTDGLGFVAVDDGYQTSASGVYAIGDVIGPPMFTHSARDDAALLYRRVFKGAETNSADRLIPHAVFTEPEVASFGPSEVEARAMFGDRVAVGIEKFRGVAKAKAIGETAGFVKIIVGPDRRIVGGTIVGPDAGNLIHELVVAAIAAMTVDELGRIIHIHPTLAEAVSAAAGGVHRPTVAE
jgi:pyruvate/2-oxoglutarate dehydrogenase complex dihydrolipoamide dehydrogenase (E3) component